MMRNFLPLLSFLFVGLQQITAQRDCRFIEYRQQLIRQHPELAVQIQDIESFTRIHLQHSRPVIVAGTGSGGTGAGTGTGQGLKVTGSGLPVVTIPVIVHILYNSSRQNISDAQVQSQIDVLNRDYRKKNADTSGIPVYFRDLVTDCGFQFALAGIDTNGNATTGIIRRHTNVSAFQLDDNIKFTAKGGDDAWDRDRYLNIWVGNLDNGVLGYSSPVGGPRATDGVTVTYTAFGTTGTAAAPFNGGRTTTHEIGHWLNMIHVWGDDNCGNDYVDDTPQQQAATYGNPSGMIVSCGNAPFGNLYMDYMDFTDDIGMHLFTNGQRDRMRTLFVEGGFRYPILSSAARTITATTPDSTATLPPATDAGVTLTFYPNPVVNSVTVTANDPSRVGSQLAIYNQVGQQVMIARVTGLPFLLDLSSLSRGVYFVRVNDGRKNDSYKLVKM